MSKIHNTIGSLKTIQIELVKNKIDDFHSLEELINFKKEYPTIKQNIIENHNLLIQNEKVKLEKELNNFHFILESKITANKSNYNLKRNALFQKIEELPAVKNKIIIIVIDFWSNFIIWSKITLNYFTYKFKYYQIIINNILNSVNTKKQYKYITKNFQEVVKQSSETELNNHELKKNVISKINNFIYGAIGEHKVANVLKDLNDEYIIINDFNYTFNTPLKNKYENSLIKTIQIDHLVIAPTGIFIIETKNWSIKSINNKELKSPITQIKNAKYALSVIVKKATLLNWSVNNHHWGNQKIPIRNILVVLNQKPIEEFDYVKICSLKELKSYIEWFNREGKKVIYTTAQVNKIANYLLRINNLKTVNSKLSI